MVLFAARLRRTGVSFAKASAQKFRGVYPSRVWCSTSPPSTSINPLI